MKKKIAIIGTGTVGQTFAERLSALGYEVMIGTRNVKEKMSAPGGKDKPSFSDWMGNNRGVKLGSFSEAAAFGETVINVTQGGASLDALKAAGEQNLSGKILVDISNPLDFSQGMPPSLIPALSNTNSLGEEIQKTFPKAKVVKTLNTMWCGIMVNPAMVNQGDHTNYICGNDQDAKAEVKNLLSDFGWKRENVLDLGGISAARGTEAVLPVWLRIWGATQNGAFNFKIVNA
jgi:predicted dinucleotide-binding enzyme